MKYFVLKFAISGKDGINLAISGESGIMSGIIPYTTRRSPDSSVSYALAY